MTSAREFYLQESLKPVLREPIEDLLARQKKIIDLNLNDKPLITINHNYEEKKPEPQYKISLDIWLKDYWPEGLSKDLFITKQQLGYLKTEDGQIFNGPMRNIGNLLKHAGYILLDRKTGVCTKLPQTFDLRPKIQVAAAAFYKALPKRFNLHDVIRASKELKLHPYFIYSNNREAYRLISTLRYGDAVSVHTKSNQGKLAVFMLHPESFANLKDQTSTPKRNRGL